MKKKAEIMPIIMNETEKRSIRAMFLEVFARDKRIIDFSLSVLLRSKQNAKLFFHIQKLSH